MADQTSDRQFTHQNAEFIATQPLRQMSRDFFECEDETATRRVSGDAFEVKTHTLADGSYAQGTVTQNIRTARYLIKGKYESDEDFNRRLERAVIPPYVEKVVNARVGIMFEKTPDRTLPGQIPEDIVRDVDKIGTGVDAFFQEITKNAMVDGIRWVLVNSPRVPEGGYKTKEEELRAGHRPFFESVPGENVIDWLVDPVTRKLVFAVIASSSGDLRTKDDYGREPKFYPQWRVWTQTEWFIFRHDAKETGKYIVEAQGVHPVGEVPLVPFFGIKKTEQSGWPVCRSILQYIKLLYNKMSDKDHWEYLLCHPIPTFYGPEKPEILDTAKGLWMKTFPGGPLVSALYLEPSGSSSITMQAAIDDLRYTIVSVALSQATMATAQVQSADTIREDRKAFTTTIRSASEVCENSELQCWKYLLAYLGAGAGGQRVEVEYNKDFEDKAIEVSMLSILSGLVPANELTLRTFLEILSKGEVLPAWVDVEEELAQLEGQQKDQEAALMAQNAAYMAEQEALAKNQ